MTDEEMAEEYADTVKCEWENDTYWVDCRDKVEEAFLAGLNKALDIKDSSDKRLEPILYKLKDLGVIASWYKNDTYHVC